MPTTVTPSDHGVKPITAVPVSPPAVTGFFDEPDEGKPAGGGGSTSPNTPPPPAAVPAATVAATEPPKPKHPDWLVRQVDALQLPPTLLDVMGTDELTQTVVTLLDRERSRRAQDADAAAARRLLDPNTGRTPAAPAGLPDATPPGPSESDAIDWGVHDETDEFGRPVKRKYSDEDVSPAVVKVVRDLRAEVKSLKAELAEITKANREHAAATARSRTRAELDAVFERMPDVFGSGDPRKLDRDQYNRRAAVARAVEGMMASLPPGAAVTITDATLAMAKSLFKAEPGTPPPPPAAGKNRPSPQDFETGHVAKPTNRNGTPVPNGRAKAIENLRERLSSLDTDDDDDDETSLEDFLK